ncbi:uncharacterized protein [Musca autumnalis]|uniref:uncharacterized protein n=1 Tax=Musca autumnalis TaxID=221902 RepID=UPI003CE80F1A
MKAVIILLALAVVLQTSVAVPVKRNVADDGKENFKVMMADIKVRLQDTVKDIPDTLSHYKKDFQEILREFDEPNNKIVCSAKMVAIIHKLREAIGKLKSDDSEDGKRVFEIARSHKNPNYNTLYKAGLEYARHPELFDEEYC